MCDIYKFCGRRLMSSQRNTLVKNPESVIAERDMVKQRTRILSGALKYLMEWGDRFTRNEIKYGINEKVGCKSEGNDIYDYT